MLHAARARQDGAHVFTVCDNGHGMTEAEVHFRLVGRGGGKDPAATAANSSKIVSHFGTGHGAATANLAEDDETIGATVKPGSTVGVLFRHVRARATPRTAA